MTCSEDVILNGTKGTPTLLFYHTVDNTPPPLPKPQQPSTTPITTQTSRPIQVPQPQQQQQQQQDQIQRMTRIIKLQQRQDRIQSLLNVIPVNGKNEFSGLLTQLMEEQTKDENEEISLVKSLVNQFTDGPKEEQDTKKRKLSEI